MDYCKNGYSFLTNGTVIIIKYPYYKHNMIKLQ